MTTPTKDSRILSLRLRPKSLDSFFGMKRVVTAIREQITTGAPNAWMFQGPSGCGKTSLARVIALSYQCQHQEIWGKPCKACWSDVSSHSIHEINASEVNKVEQCRGIVEQSRYRPQPPSKYRVFILDEAQRLTTDSQNLLLKPFEEPADTTIWIICTTAHEKIIPTLRKRCMTYQVRPLSMSGVETFLVGVARRTKISFSDDLIDAVHQAGINAPRDLLMVLEKINAGASISLAVSGINEESGSTLALCKAIVGGEWPATRKMLQDLGSDEVRLIRGAIAGYLRAILLRETNVKKQKILVESLRDLTTNVPFEDSSMALWLIPVVYDICQRFKRV